MNLKELCELAAVYTDRRDDFVTITDKNGNQVYDPEDDPGVWFSSFKNSINNAYREVARKLLTPDMRKIYELDENREIDLFNLQPEALQLIAVYNEDGSAALKFDFVTMNRIRLRMGRAGDRVMVHYHYAPDPLEKFEDSPVFPEGLVDPMVYISRAAADLWMLERKAQPAQMWESRYYSMLSGIQKDMKSAAMRKIKKSRFR